WQRGPTAKHPVRDHVWKEPESGERTLGKEEADARVRHCLHRCEGPRGIRGVSPESPGHDRGPRRAVSRSGRPDRGSRRTGTRKESSDPRVSDPRGREGLVAGARVSAAARDSGANDGLDADPHRGSLAGIRSSAPGSRTTPMRIGASFEGSTIFASRRLSTWLLAMK